MTLLFAGCTTLPPTPEAYTRDGVAYGTTEGTFRGRWWNYYERGRSFADGGYWAEAEADFRTALAQRDVDQWWARTYGLHFVNEYFPNRELGVALLEQGQIEAAIGALQASLAQEHSARAAFYLDEARAQQVSASDADTDAPIITLVSPAPDAALTSLATEVRIAARDDTYVREVRINGEPAPIALSAPEVQVNRPIAMPAGDATVTVEAIDITGKRSTETFTFATDHDGPAIAFNAPIVVPGTISGTVYDPAGIEAIEVGDAQAAVSGAGSRTTFTIDLQHVDTTAPLRFIATDALGNTTTGTVPTDSLMLSGAQRLCSAAAIAAALQSPEAPTKTSISTIRLAAARHCDERVFERGSNLEVVQSPRAIPSASFEVFAGLGASFPPSKGVARSAGGCSAAGLSSLPNRCQFENLTRGATSPALEDSGTPFEGGKGVGFASTPQTIEHNGLRAYLVDNRPVAVTRIAQADTAPIAIEFTNLADGQRYLKDEIIVSLHIASANDIASVTLNNIPVPGILPTSHDQRISRRIRLDSMGPAIIAATVRDTSGAEATTQVQIERVPTAAEEQGSKLSLAVLGNVWEGANPGLAEEANFITDELTRKLYEQGRFDLISRDALPEVLAEQELAAALGKGPAPSDLVPAELMVAGRVRRGTDSFEIVLQAVDPKTSQILAYADVAGKADSRADLAQLVSDLALRLEQEFPRVQGSIVQVRAPDRISSTLATADRIKRNMHCIVFRKGEEIIHPQTGASLGSPTEILAEGWIEEVQRQMSTIALASAAATPIEVSDFVVTK